VSGANRAMAKQFGQDFFDGSRDVGYGGYKYDGRWVAIAKRFKEYYGLADNAAILDVGCAKGFMLHDFKALMPQAQVAGVDISSYAIDRAMEDVKPFLKVGNCKSLPFPDKSFDLVIAINTVHNLPYAECAQALSEIERVSRKHKFIVVDAYKNDEEKERMYQWNLTAETILHADDWQKLFAQAKYTGDYLWFTP
jgi:ubiquinone/menaquinone biosynthesis C-methylase UbiE